MKLFTSALITAAAALTLAGAAQARSPSRQAAAISKWLRH